MLVPLVRGDGFVVACSSTMAVMRQGVGTVIGVFAAVAVAVT